MAELAYGYGWTDGDVLSLPVRKCRMYLEQLAAIKRDEYLMQLRIARDPYTKEDAQRQFWQELSKPVKTRPGRKMTEERRREAQALLERKKRV